METSWRDEWYSLIEKKTSEKVRKIHGDQLHKPFSPVTINRVSGIGEIVFESKNEVIELSYKKKDIGSCIALLYELFLGVSGLYPLLIKNDENSSEISAELELGVFLDRCYEIFENSQKIILCPTNEYRDQWGKNSKYLMSIIFYLVEERHADEYWLNKELIKRNKKDFFS